MMLKLFRFRKKGAPAIPLQEKAAGMVVTKVLWLQNKWALLMDRKVNRLSVRSKKYGLMVFVVLSLLVIVSIQIETFTGKHAHSLNFGKMQKQVLQKDEPVATIPMKEYKKVVAFQKFMDSLSSTMNGKKIYDSIMKCRPGLLDSAKLLEKLYHNQNK